MKKYLVTAAAATAFLSACGGNLETNSNAANSNANANRAVVKELDPKDLPSGLSGSPVPANSAPGITRSGNANVAANSAPPGIGEINPTGKPKPGATPTPGIPDPETIRRQMQSGQGVNINASAPGNTVERPRRKVNRPIGNTPQ